MTEIPDYLLKRAQNVRVKAQNSNIDFQEKTEQTPSNSLYYESHVTIDYPETFTSEELDDLRQLAERYNFKPANLYMVKDSSPQI